MDLEIYKFYKIFYILIHIHRYFRKYKMPILVLKNLPFKASKLPVKIVETNQIVLTLTEYCFGLLLFMIFSNDLNRH